MALSFNSWRRVLLTLSLLELHWVLNLAAIEALQSATCCFLARKLLNVCGQLGQRSTA
jgi:hypothetical protein